MRQYLLGEADAAWARWKAAFEERISDPHAIRIHERELQKKFIAAIGGLPERTPLHARATGTLQRDGFRVEKVIFESQPGFFVTAALFLPDPSQHAAPYPGVLVPCGHYEPAKAYDEYQSVGALLALNGMAALVFDPIEQGERRQSVDVSAPRFRSAVSHTLDDIQAIPLGQSVARYFIWDGMRGVDYLQSRPEIDPERIGCTGNSGGATQTSYLFALDDRIKVAVPSCYVQYLAAQIRDSIGDGEQNIFGQLAFGLDHPDFLLMRAPAPVKLLAATRDFFDIRATWETFRIVKRTYTSLGASERVDILENDAGHNYNRIQREGAVRWLARWLLGSDEAIEEPPLELFTEEEMRCAPQGQVMLLPGARSIRDLFREGADDAAAERHQRWAGLGAVERREAVRKIAGFRALDALPSAAWTQVWERPGLDCRLEAWRVRTSDGALDIPALWIEPDQPGEEPACVFLSDRGIHAEMEAGGRLADLARSGRRILALGLRGTGATRQTKQPGMAAAVGRDYWDIYTAYMLGRSYVGMQAEDVLAAVREMQRRTGGDARIDLMAFGGVGVPALHAAFAEPGRFQHIQLEGMITSWDEVVRAKRTYGQLMNVVRGALLTYDLPDLAESLGSTLTRPWPTSALGLELDQTTPPSAADQAPTQPSLMGIYYGSPKSQNPQATDRLSDGDAKWNTMRERRGRDWSAQWAGFLVPGVSGAIHLALETTERATLSIDGREVALADEINPRATAIVELASGEPVPCAIHFEQLHRESNPADYTSRLRLSWRTPESGWQPVPASWLHHSRQQEREAERALR